jgi:molecular chaperone GrpE
MTKKINKPEKNKKTSEMNESEDVINQDLPKEDFEEQNVDKTAEEKLAEAQEQVLRTLADSENLRRRLEREKEDLSNYIISNFAKEILLVIDNLQRALKSIDDKKDDNTALEQFVEGIELTEKQLISSLEKFKINKINSENETFNPNLHQAMFEVEGGEDKLGKVSEVIQDGYTIGERLLRPAMVGVFKNKKSN